MITFWAVQLHWSAGENVAPCHYRHASNSNIWMFSTNSNLCLLTKCYGYGVKRILHQRHAPQDNTILPTEVANFPAETGSGRMSHSPHTLLAPGLVTIKMGRATSLVPKSTIVKSLFKNTGSELETDCVLGKGLRLSGLKQNVLVVIWN